MIKMIRSTEPTEHQIQCAIVEWANHTFVQNPTLGQVCLGQYLIKIPNEGKRSWVQGKKMKKEGLKKGVSDLFLAIPKMSPYIQHGLWIEVKSINGKISKAQIEWESLMMSAGYHCCCPRSVDEGIWSIKNYVGIV